MARLALVDDHAFLRKGVETVLIQAGHEMVLSTGDCANAKALIEAAQPDLVILDQRMMPISGASILNLLRRDGNLVPVIFLVNELPDDALLSIMKLGVNGIVFKHCPADSLFQAIDAVLAGRRYIDGSLIDKSLALSSNDMQDPELAELTIRERNVALLVCEGLRNKQIGERLGMTEGTVKIHLHNVYRKLRVSNRTSLAIRLQAAD